MKTSMTLESDLSRGLRMLPSALTQKVVQKALAVSAEPIRAEAAARAPRDEKAPPPHLADHIVIDVLTESEIGRGAEWKGDEAVVQIGPTVQHFYGYFSEFGTAHEPARPWFRPAFDSKSGAAFALYASTIWVQIRKAAAALGRNRQHVPSNVGTAGGRNL